MSVHKAAVKDQILISEAWYCHKTEECFVGIFTHKFYPTCQKSAISDLSVSGREHFLSMRGISDVASQNPESVEKLLLEVLTFSLPFSLRAPWKLCEIAPKSCYSASPET